MENFRAEDMPKSKAPASHGGREVKPDPDDYHADQINQATDSPETNPAGATAVQVDADATSTEDKAETRKADKPAETEEKKTTTRRKAAPKAKDKDED